MNSPTPNPFRDPHTSIPPSHTGSTNPYRNGTAARHSTPARAQSTSLKSAPSSSLPARSASVNDASMLARIRRDERRAYRAPHLRKRQLHGIDSIDKLDDSSLAYHHGGPYDAASVARNNDPRHAPVAALTHSTAEALRATPRDKLRDALLDHRPLDGVALFPPGTRDPWGQAYEYEEGTDMMREANPEGGPYKRWPGVEYLPGDLKGKGEPSYSLDERAKEKRRAAGEGAEGVEMVAQPPARGLSRSGSIRGELRKRLSSTKHKFWSSGSPLV